MVKRLLDPALYFLEAKVEGKRSSTQAKMLISFLFISQSEKGSQGAFLTPNKKTRCAAPKRIQFYGTYDGEKEVAVKVMKCKHCLAISDLSSCKFATSSNNRVETTQRSRQDLSND